MTPPYNGETGPPGIQMGRRAVVVVVVQKEEEKERVEEEEKEKVEEKERVEDGRRAAMDERSLGHVICARVRDTTATGVPGGVPSAAGRTLDTAPRAARSGARSGLAAPEGVRRAHLGRVEGVAGGCPVGPPR
jgi:hypothetical protein